MRRTLAASGILVLAACSTPVRDNPSDPVHGLEVALVAHLLGSSENSGPWNQPFVLDVSATVNRTGAPVVYRFDLDDDPATFEATLPLVTCAGTTSGPAACATTAIPVPPALAAAKVGAFEREIRVQAKAGDHVAIASARVVLTNAAPVVNAGEDRFVPELTSGPVQLDACGGRLVCSSFDPDDPQLDTSKLHFLWTQLRGDPVVLSSSTAQMPQFTAPRDEQTLLFRLTVNDGLASTSALARVRVTTQAWVSTTAPAFLLRVFPDFRRVAEFPQDVASSISRRTQNSGLDLDASGSVLAAHIESTAGGDYTRIQRFAPGIAGLSTAGLFDLSDLGPGISSSVALAGNEGCATFWNTMGSDWGFVRLAPNTTHSLAVIDPTLEPRFVASAGGSDCWAVSSPYPYDGGGSVHVSRFTGGVLTEVAANPMRVAEAILPAPDGTLWIAGRDVPDELSTTGRLVHLSSTGAILFDAPVPQRVDELVFAPDSGFIAHDPLSLRLFSLEISGSTVTATLLDTPEIGLPQRNGDLPPSSPRMQIDPIERDVWIAEGFLGSLVKAHIEEQGPWTISFAPGGSLGLGSTATYTAVRLDDRHGRVVVSNETGAAGALGFVPSHLERVRPVFISAQQSRVAVDPQRGDVWIAATGGGLQTSLRKITSTGQTLVEATLPFPAFAVAAQPDGGAWAALYDAATDSGLLVQVDRLGQIVTPAFYPLPPPGGMNNLQQILAVSGQTTDPAICALGRDYPNDFGEPLRLTPGAQTAAMPGATWMDPHNLRADAGVCWASFGGTVVRYDGTSASSVSLFQPGSIDVDSYTHEAWVVAPAGAGEGVYLIDAALDPPVLMFGDDGRTLDGVDVQRRCAASGCAAGTALNVWVSRGDTLDRDAADGTILDEYYLGPTGGLLDLQVVP